MEYLSTGKVIVSNNITTYRDTPELIQMVEERNHNRALPLLFKKVISNLDTHNAPLLAQKRIKYATANSYSNQIARIEEIVQNELSESFATNTPGV